MKPVPNQADVVAQSEAGATQLLRRLPPCLDLVEAAQETFQRREGELDRLSEDTDRAPAEESGAGARHD